MEGPSHLFLCPISEGIARLKGLLDESETALKKHHPTEFVKRTRDALKALQEEHQTLVTKFEHEYARNMTEYAKRRCLNADDQHAIQTNVWRHGHIRTTRAFNPQKRRKKKKTKIAPY
jgi:hypothetical protein